MSSLSTLYLKHLQQQMNTQSNHGYIVWKNTGQDQFIEEHDLHLWIITESRLSFQEMQQLSNEELRLRKKFQEDYNIPYFANHRVSIFSKDEAKEYLQKFYWKYYLPLSQFSDALILNYTVPQLYLTHEEIQTDLVTTLQERLETFSYNRQEKLLTYNLRDYNYYSGLNPGFPIAPSAPEFKNISSYIEVHARQPFLKLSWNRQTHAVLSLLEQVRWDLVNVYSNKQLLHTWKKTASGELYSSLPMLGNFLFQLALTKRCKVTLKLKELGRMLTQLLHEQSTDIIPEIYERLSDILFESIKPHHDKKLPLQKSYSVTLPVLGETGTDICKISNDEKYIISEYEGQQRYAPSAPHKVAIGNISYIISPFINGKSYSTEHMEILAELLIKTHQTKGNFFGRVGTGPYYSSFVGFLQDRLNRVPPSQKFYQPLSGIFTILKEQLYHIPPVACHMDPNPGNILIHPQKSTLIDWEHFSYCAREWDIERAIFEYSEEEQKKFRALYYKQEEYNPHISTFVQILVTATFAVKLPKSERRTRLLSICNNLTHELFATLSKKLQSGKNNYSTLEGTAPQHRGVREHHT